MRVLGEALYSTPHVVVRELVQNAHDSIERRRYETREAPVPEISVRCDSANGLLAIEDNGAGLTAEEVKGFLATVGTGHTRAIRDDGGGSSMIGYFGLGFLSAFAVAKRTEVWSCSYQTPDRACRFISRTGETYTLEEAEPREIGTTVTLHLKEDLLEIAKVEFLRDLLRHYCGLLRHPVALDGEVINDQPVPWRRDEAISPLRARKLSLEVAGRFERNFEPITAWTFASAPEHEIDVCGLFWIQDATTYASSDNRNVSVFVRGMLINDDERDLIPRWAGFIGAVVECDSLHPTASREALQRDSNFDQAAAFLREELIRSLATLAGREPESWRRAMRRHNEGLRGASLADPRLFDLLADELTVPTDAGEMTLPAVLSRTAGKIYLSQAERGGFEELLFRALKVPVVKGHLFAVLPFCQRYAESKRGALVALGDQGSDALLLRPAAEQPAARARLEALFGHEDRTIVPSHFEPSFLPFVLVRDRAIALKRSIEDDEADRRIGGAVLSLARRFTKGIDAGPASRLHVNMSCPAVQGLLAADGPRAGVGVKLMRPLIELLADPGAGSDIQDALEDFSAALQIVLAEDT